MTGGGDLDEIEDEDTDVMDDEDAASVDALVVDVDLDDAGVSGGSEAATPVPDALGVNENDPDPTAGASDVGGRAGGDDAEGPTGS